MSPITLLIFAYHFPPENSIGGQRPFRFYKYLSRMGYRCHVITAARQEEASPDITYVPDPFIETQRDGAGWQVERFIRKFLLPGVVGVRWARMAAKAGQAIIRANQTGPVAILSTFPPLGTHIAGWELSRCQGVPWIADFRDPMGDNPGHVGFSQAQHGLYNSLEHPVFRSADLIIANTDTAADQWRARYPEKKNRIHLIWNGFDPENKLLPLPVPEHKRKVVSHVGSLYGGRTVTPLLESVARSIERGQLSRDSICINLVGEALPGCIPSADFVDRAKSEGWLDLSGNVVSQKEARRISQTSDGLLLIQPHSSVQVPGKIFEYVQIGRPVLAFVPENSPIERILAQSGITYRCVYANQSNERMDEQLLDFFRLPSAVIPPNAWFEEQFDGCRQVETLDRYIREMMA